MIKLYDEDGFPFTADPDAYVWRVTWDVKTKRYVPERIRARRADPWDGCYHRSEGDAVWEAKLANAQEQANPREHDPCEWVAVEPWA